MAACHFSPTPRRRAGYHCHPRKWPTSSPLRGATLAPVSLSLPLLILADNGLCFIVLEGIMCNDRPVIAHWVTCGLRISSSHTVDNLTRQETTSQTDLEAGADGDGLSCPGSRLKGYDALSPKLEVFPSFLEMERTAASILSNQLRSRKESIPMATGHAICSSENLPVMVTSALAIIVT